MLFSSLLQLSFLLLLVGGATEHDDDVGSSSTSSSKREWASDYIVYRPHSSASRFDGGGGRPPPSSPPNGGVEDAKWLRQEYIRDRLPPEGYHYGSVHQTYVAHTFTIADPVDHVTVLPPWMGCGEGLATPEETAAHYPSKCRVAINGGFFNPDPNTTNECIGNIVSDGRKVQWNWTHPDASFGIGYRKPLERNHQRAQEPPSPPPATDDATTIDEGQPLLVVGYLNGTSRREFDWMQFISGYGWIVRNGEKFVDQSIAKEDASVQKTGTAAEFRHLHAPRSAIGHDVTGRVVVVAIDGQEDLSIGASLDQLANILISMGIINAINLDGGGSVSVWSEHALVNVPSDICPPPDILDSSSGASDGSWWGVASVPGAPTVRCPRKVASVICVADASMQLADKKTPSGTVSLTQQNSGSLEFPSHSQTVSAPTTTATTDIDSSATVSHSRNHDPLPSWQVPTAPNKPVGVPSSTPQPSSTSTGMRTEASPPSLKPRPYEESAAAAVMVIVLAVGVSILILIVAFTDDRRRNYLNLGGVDMDSFA